MAKNPRTGSRFDDFLKDQGIYEECSAAALLRVLARQIEREMEKQQLTKSVMAAQMNTSRSQLDRLLDPDNDKVQLDTLFRAARAVGKDLEIHLV